MYEFHLTIRSGDDEEILVIANPRRDDDGDGPFLIRLDVHGRVAETIPIPYKIRHVVSPSKTQLILVDEHDKTHAILPGYAPTNFNFFHVKPLLGMVSGYHVNGDGDGQSVWNFRLGDGQFVSDYVIKEPRAVFSRVENGLAKVVDEPIVAVSVVERDGDGRSGVSVYIIHGFTGKVIHHAVHENGDGPIPITISDNLVVYSFFNVGACRQELVAIELYHANTRGHFRVYQVL